MVVPLVEVRGWQDGVAGWAVGGAASGEEAIARGCEARCGSRLAR